ncbi:MAG TPA: Holliday junction branch migration protein RuvA [Candidatus Paceibacterota bacterium]|nr:Holliday junction branch migration protein RuvA [Candidatus Paceibacterota bacterium]
MIGKLTGRYGGASGDGTHIVEVNGVGYCVRVPTLMASSLGSAPDAISLFIHTAVRDDAIDLYGFSSEGDLSFFRQLLGVSGIGPKSALAVLSVAEVPALKRAIAQGDSAMLTKVFGIGKKSAERIVVELRDKLMEESTARGEAVGAGEDGEVVEALLSLGYSAAESRKAAKESAPAAAQGGVRERLAAALKYLGSHSR